MEAPPEGAKEEQEAAARPATYEDSRVGVRVAGRVGCESKKRQGSCFRSFIIYRGRYLPHRLPSSCYTLIAALCYTAAALSHHKN